MKTRLAIHLVDHVHYTTINGIGLLLNVKRNQADAIFRQFKTKGAKTVMAQCDHLNWDAKMNLLPVQFLIDHYTKAWCYINRVEYDPKGLIETLQLLTPDSILKPVIISYSKLKVA